MVNKKWIAQCCISLTVLSSYVPNAFAQQSSMKTDNCLVEQTDLSTDKNLRREVQDKTSLTNSNSNAKIASIKLKQLNVFNTELEEENNALFRFANRAHIQTEPDVINNLYYSPLVTSTTLKSLLNLSVYFVKKAIYMMHKLVQPKIATAMLM